MTFRDSIADSEGVLIRDQLQSSNFDISTGAGWEIKRDGTAFLGNVYLDGIEISPSAIASPNPPLLHLASLMRLWGEVNQPISYQASAQIDTTTSHFDLTSTYGGLVLPHSANFSPGNGGVNFEITVNLDIFAGGVAPAGQFMFQLFNNAVAVNPDFRVILDVNGRGAYSKSWIIPVGYVSGVPQNTITGEVWQSVAGNAYHLSGGSLINIKAFPKFDSFVS